MEYPHYYRQPGRCLKRESDITAREIKIPPQGHMLPCCMEDVIYPSKERLDEEVIKMTKCTQDDYEDFIGGFTAGSREISRSFNDYRQIKYNKTQTINT
jgi:hypothetical protein